MANKKPVQASFNRPEWKGFLECPLTDAQLTDADSIKTTAKDIFEYLHSFLETGNELSLSYQSATKTYTVTMKDTRKDSPTAGYAISTRDATALDCLKLAMFKHFNVLGTDWSSLLATPPKARRG